MARWQPDAKGRLQRAAVELFLERGYAEVTVADITERAGLTKRTFFNHFADKREVLFADAEAFQASITEPLADLDPEIAPLEAAIAALTRAGGFLADYSQFAALRRTLIASAPELQERNLTKNAALSQALEAGLIERGADPRTARLSAQAALSVFHVAYDDWIDDPEADFPVLMSRVLEELRDAIDPARAQARASAPAGRSA